MHLLALLGTFTDVNYKYCYSNNEIPENGVPPGKVLILNLFFGGRKLRTKLKFLKGQTVFGLMKGW